MEHWLEHLQMLFVLELLSSMGMASLSWSSSGTFLNFSHSICFWFFSLLANNESSKEKNLEKRCIKDTCVPNLVLATEMQVEDKSLYFCIMLIECMKLVGAQWNSRRNKAFKIPALITLSLQLCRNCKFWLYCKMQFKPSFSSAHIHGCSSIKRNWNVLI